MQSTKRVRQPLRKLDGRQQVDRYIAGAPQAAQPMLRQLRRLVRATAPKCDERLSYRMPYYSYHGRLIYFAAFSRHVGVYIMGRSKERFAKALEPYRSSPSTLRFPFGSKLPLTLLKRLIVARAKENLVHSRARRGAVPS